MERQTAGVFWQVCWSCRYGGYPLDVRTASGMGRYCVTIQRIKQTIHYKNLDDIKKHLISVGKEIKTKGLPQSLTPFIIGFAGYGNVSMGAQEILDLLPIIEVPPENLASIFENPSNKVVYKVVFKEEHMVEPTKPGTRFDLQDYYKHPENYRSCVHAVSPFSFYFYELHLLEHATLILLRKISKENPLKMIDILRLKVIGDISADVNGAVNSLKKQRLRMPLFLCTIPYRYDTRRLRRGWGGDHGG